MLNFNLLVAKQSGLGTMDAAGSSQCGKPDTMRPIIALIVMRYGTFVRERQRIKHSVGFEESLCD